MGAVATLSNTRVERLDCNDCGIPFWVSEEWVTCRRQDHKTFRCPNGHSLYFPGESEEEKLTRRLSFERNRREAAEHQARTAEYQRRAAKGQLTRMKKRIAEGICPCCQEAFKDVRRHMASQHPDFLEQIREAEA